MTINSGDSKRKRGSIPSVQYDIARYARSAHTVDPEASDLVFQLLECEDASKDKQDGDTSLLRLHGLTDCGHSVIVLVRGFHQYLYFPISQTFTKTDFAAFEEAIKHNIHAEVVITSMEIVERDPLDFFRKKPELYRRYIKIEVQKPTDVNAIGNVLGKSDELPKLLNLYKAGKLFSTQVYETGLAYDMRFMADKGIVGCGWVRLVKGSYHKLTNELPYERASSIFECDHTAVVGLSPDSTEADDAKTKEFSKLAPLRCLIPSCIVLDSAPIKRSSSVQNSPKKAKTSKISGRNKSQAQVAEDEPDPFIAAISVVMTTSPLEPSSKDHIVVLTHGQETRPSLNSCPDAEVMCFSDERSMLEVFRDIFLAYDPDVVAGYDITSEAIPTILSRALDLGLSKDYINLARCSHVSLKTRRRQIYSSAWLKKDRKMNATSNREHTELGCIGRLVLDLRTVIEREERLRTYTLNESLFVITGQTLEKLSDTTLLELRHSEDDDDQARLLDYSAREVMAALALMRRHASLITYIELSRVTGLNFEDVVSRGQMRRFWSQLFRFCRARNTIVPGKSRGGEQMSESALNYMPDVGYDTENPVIVLDFKSLYPSILIARNLCFSTEICPGTAFDGESWTGFGGCRFVTSDQKEGIVPQILKHFLSERGKVKRLMQDATDPGMISVLDGRQKAIKVVANAVYGFMGSPQSNLQNIAIANGTITEGARLLEEAKQEIEKRYNSRQGVLDEVKVVYGDTDSVFVKVFGKSVSEAIILGKQMSQEVSKIWPAPIQLDFEKVLFPSLLQNRKRYAGLLWTDPGTPDKIDIKGIEVNRRDAVPLIEHVIGDMLAILFPFRNNSTNPGDCSGKILPAEREDIIAKVKASVRKDIDRVLAGTLNVGSYIMTKGLWLGTNATDYAAKQTHISVIDKMRLRDSRRLFKDGERISYVFTQSTPNAKGHEKAEDPVYAINKGLLLDYQYYLDHTVHNPVQRILELFMSAKEIDLLFKSTKASKKAPVAKSAGVMGAFLSAGKKALSRCEVCGDQCVSGKLCQKHKSQSESLAMDKKSKFDQLREQKDRAYELCYSCQGSKRKILCVNMDCEVYFDRRKLDEQAEAAEEDLSGFVQAEGLDLAW